MPLASSVISRALRYEFINAASEGPKASRDTRCGTETGEPHSWATLPTPASAAAGGATSLLARPGAGAQKPSGSSAMTTLSPVTGVGQTREGQGRKPGDDRGGPAWLWETQPIPGVSGLHCYHLPNPHTTPHFTPGLTPLQTWPPPAPRCDPGSCWQLWGARGGDGAGGCQVQERWRTQG